MTTALPSYTTSRDVTEELDAWVDSRSFTSTSEEIQVSKENRNA